MTQSINARQSNSPGPRQDRAMELQRKEDEDIAVDEGRSSATDLREKAHRDQIIERAAKQNNWEKIVDRFKHADAVNTQGKAEDGLNTTGRQALMQSLMEAVDQVLQDIAPSFWHETDVEHKVQESVNQALSEREHEKSPTVGAKRARTDKPGAPYSLTEQAIEMRRPNFGFLRLAWERCTWSVHATTACHATYKVAVLDKLTAAELITTEAMIKDLLAEMDGWCGRLPTKTEIEKNKTKLERLFSRAQGLAAPKGAGGAISTAIDRTFSEEGLDPKFKAASTAAAQVEMLALAGGYGAMAGSGVRGALSLYRGMQESGSHRGGRGGPRGSSGGARGGRGTKTKELNPDITCWGCGAKGHPKSQCPKSKDTTKNNGE